MSVRERIGFSLGLFLCAGMLLYVVIAWNALLEQFGFLPVVVLSLGLAAIAAKILDLAKDKMGLK